MNLANFEWKRKRISQIADAFIVLCTFTGILNPAVGGENGRFYQWPARASAQQLDKSSNYLAQNALQISPSPYVTQILPRLSLFSGKKGASLF